jgi:hypothetical protein
MKLETEINTLVSIQSLSIASSKNDVTPVITQIALKRDGDVLKAMTTDRFMALVGTYENVVFHDWEDGQEMLVDPKALKSAIALKKADKYDMETMTVMYENDRASIAINRNTVVDLGSIGNFGSTGRAFPPLQKLFPEDEPSGAGSLNIRPDFIAKLAKVLPPESKPQRDRVWRFEFRSIDTPNRPQPVYATYSDGNSYKLEALIQPAMDKASVVR